MSAAPKPQVKTGEGQLALWTAGAGLALSLLLVLWEPAATLQAYAVIAVTLLAPALGALAALGCFQLTGGHWGELARPALLALLGLLPIALLGLVPALFDLAQVFDWAQPVALLPEVVRRKQPYLNAPFFIARTVGFALLWLLSAQRARVPHGVHLGLSRASHLPLFLDRSEGPRSEPCYLLLTS